MAKKADRGTKRTCQACGGRFYDLDRDPIVCPMCNVTLVLEKPKPKPEAPAPKAEKPTEAAKPAAAAAANPTSNPTSDPTSGADPAIDSAIDSGGAVAKGEGDGASEIEAEDDLADIEVADANLAPENGDEPVLETDDSDDDDVTGIIDAPLPKKEEEG